MALFDEFEEFDWFDEFEWGVDGCQRSFLRFSTSKTSSTHCCNSSELVAGLDEGVWPPLPA
jgi:hypothetical protein